MPQNGHISASLVCRAEKGCADVQMSPDFLHRLHKNARNVRIPQPYRAQGPLVRCACVLKWLGGKAEGRQAGGCKSECDIETRVRGRSEGMKRTHMVHIGHVQREGPRGDV